MRTYIYVDGFNLYYGAIKETPYKWLDLKALFQRVLERHHDIRAIKYYTASVSARASDPNAPTRQQIYLHALQTHIPEITITKGHFLENPVMMRLANPKGYQKYAEVLKTEEKGSDVNLAVHALNDAWHNRYDCAVICSNDSDLAESLRLIKTEHKKRIILVVPGNPLLRPPAIQLKRYSTATLSIEEADLAASQLPNPIPGTKIHKPVKW